MKKLLILIFVSVIVFSLINKANVVVVPEESIRFRVVAASNSKEDIEIKEKLTNSIINNYEYIFKTETIEDSRYTINNSVENIKKEIDDTFESLNYEKEYTINYGINYFPEKIYEGVKYSEGNYESLVITIGEGKGNNYWCVMFPPLCMIDESVDKEDIEYKFKVLEILEKIKSINN